MIHNKKQTHAVDAAPVGSDKILNFKCFVCSKTQRKISNIGF